MSNTTRVSKALLAAAVAVSLIGCSKDQSESGTPPAQSEAPAHTTALPVVSAPAPSATPPAPVRDCPTGSKGEGTSKAPCEADQGTKRMMEVVWTKKTTDEGPFFRVTNQSDQTIVYGKIVVYFYDKAGKQLDVIDAAAATPKPHPNQVCSGNVFGGVMKPGEKAVMTFSCVQKKHVPEGTATIEAEAQMVGYADASEKKADLFWRNTALTPDVRPKGGVKK